MGVIEEKFRKKKRKGDIQKAILATVKVAGLLSVALIAPNVTQVLKSFGFVRSQRQKEIIKRSKDNLIKEGGLKYEGKFLRLTEKGQVRLELLEASDWKINKPKKWDGKWRMLIFDIPENRRLLRDKIRATLFSIGFVKLQNSVWIFPYPCEDLINLLKADFKVGKDLLYLIVDSIENDKSFRKIYNLSQNI